MNSLDRCNVKEEAEQIEQFSFDDDPRKDSTLKRITFEKDTAKCGEVMVAREGTFTFVCSLCLQTFGELLSFGIHIQEQHVQFEFRTAAFKREKESDPLCAPVQAATLVRLDTNIDSSGLNAAATPTEHGAQNDTQMNSDAEIKDERDEQLDPSSSSDEQMLRKKKGNKSKARILEESFCVFCGRIYKDRRRFTLHMKNAHKNESEANIVNGDVSNAELKFSVPHIMTCKYCDQTFHDLAAFRAHVTTHTGRRRFVCPYCPKMFDGVKSRSSHINTHTGERPYKCTHCPKGFADATNLEMHVRTHLRIMKYSCDYCDKRFVQSSEKKVHERTHTGEKPFQCEECGRRFISHVKLTEHGRRHKNIKNYKCKVCEKAFYTSNLLKDHMVAHTGERPFRCNACGQDFSRRKALRAHEQLHSDEKKYVCNTCGKAFAQCAGLYSHRKSHGKKPK